MRGYAEVNDLENEVYPDYFRIAEHTPGISPIHFTDGLWQLKSGLDDTFTYCLPEIRLKEAKRPRSAKSVHLRQFFRFSIATCCLLP